MVIVNKSKTVNAWEKFREKYGSEAYRNLWLEEFEEEVANLFRLTNDFRPLNDETVKWVFPLPLIKDLIEGICGKNFIFSTSDIQDAFYTIIRCPPSACCCC